MSWLFGIKPNVTPPPDAPSTHGAAGTSAPPPGGSGGPPTNDKIGAQTHYQFDSTALERAAKAAKDLEKSPYAAQALDLSMKQEETRKKEMEVKIKEFDVAIAHSKIEHEREAGEQQRKTLGEQQKIAKNRADYEHQLALKRQEEQLRKQEEHERQRLALQEESVKKQELMRRETVKRELEMRAEQDFQRIKAEKEAQARLERENRDLYLEQLKVKMSEQRTTVLETIKAGGTLFSSAFQWFIGDPPTVFKTVGAVALLAGGVYGAKSGVGLLARYLDARLGKPSLVRETSRIGPLDFVRHPVQSTKLLYRRRYEDPMKGVVLEPKLERRLFEIAITTKNAKRNNGFFRNIMFYGPPGTGKTLFAKRLALTSRLDYAILTGGDVAPMGRDGVSAMHKVFDWANASRRGLLLFVDEADAFLRKRSTERISEDMRATLNAFLYRTGEQSKKFILVLASNQPEQFDWAVNDRIDEMVNFRLPGLAERERMFLHYFREFIAEPATRRLGRQLKVQSGFSWDKKCRDIAAKTEGLSGREISKLVVSWQASAYASEDGVLTEQIMDERVADAVAQHKQKQLWLQQSEGGVSGVSEKVLASLPRRGQS